MASTFRLKRKCFAGYFDSTGKFIDAANTTGKISSSTSVFGSASFDSNGLAKPAGDTVLTGGTTHGGTTRAFESNANFKKQNLTAKQRKQNQTAFQKQSQADKLKYADTIKQNKANLQHQQAMRAKAASNVGVMQGMKNTWGRMGTMGKVGTGAAVATGGYFLGKGLGLWGNKKDK